MFSNSLNFTCFLRYYLWLLILCFFFLLFSLCRLLSVELVVVPRLDLSGCALLYGQYNASMYHLRRSLLITGLSNALRPE